MDQNSTAFSLRLKIAVHREHRDGCEAQCSLPSERDSPSVKSHIPTPVNSNKHLARQARGR